MDKQFQVLINTKNLVYIVCYGQIIILLQYVLGDGYHVFGWQALKDLILGLDWQASPMFPRITLCSFEIRRLGQNIHRYTVQCLLSVNLFNEKVRITFVSYILMFEVAN